MEYNVDTHVDGDVDLNLDVVADVDREFSLRPVDWLTNQRSGQPGAGVQVGNCASKIERQGFESSIMEVGNCVCGVGRQGLRS